MEGSGYTYNATSRIPIRPLSIENKDLALPKELLMDYTNAEMYICDINGEIVNITQQMLDATEEMLKNHLKSEDATDIIKNVNITLTNGNTVSIEMGIIMLFDMLTTSVQDINSTIDTVRNTIPTAATNTPKASNENGSVGSKKKVFALEDHVHPKGLATVADSANSVEWKNVQNTPSFSLDTHNHDSDYFKKTGGTITGDTTLSKSTLYATPSNSNTRICIAYADTNNRVHISNNSHPIFLDGKILFNSVNYGTAEPNSITNPVTGQIYLQLI